MNKAQQDYTSESWIEERVSADKPVYRNQSLGDRIDGEKKTFKSHGTEQRRTVRRNETRSRNLSAVQSQPSLCDGPNVSASAGDHDTLGARGFQLEPFRERSRHHAKRSSSIHKQLDFFNASRRAGQLAFYVKQTHFKRLFKNRVIVAQPINSARTLMSAKNVAKPAITLWSGRQGLRW
jgi:hypothetical protein